VLFTFYVSISVFAIPFFKNFCVFIIYFLYLAYLTILIQVN